MMPVCNFLLLCKSSDRENNPPAMKFCLYILDSKTIRKGMCNVEIMIAEGDVVV